MHKNEFIRQLAKETALPQKEVSQVVRTALDLIARNLKSGEKVVLTGFGTFEVRKRSPRRGVNPQTKQHMQIEGTLTPGFTASTTLKNVVLGKIDPASVNRDDDDDETSPRPRRSKNRKSAKIEVDN